LKVISSGSDITYPVTKSYALKGTLISHSTLQSLAESRDLADLITKLKATPYSDVVSRIQQPHSGYKIELAAREHVSNLHYNLMKVYPDADVLYAYYMKYVVGDLKTVLKGKAIGRSYEEIQRYLDMRAEELIRRRDLISRAVAAASLDEVVTTFRGTEFHKVIDNAVKAYRSTHKTDVFDVFLDKALYEGILGASIKKTVKHLISIDVDSYNVLTVLRAKSWDVSQAQVRSLIAEPTFYVPKNILERMIAAATVSDAIRYLTATRYRNLVPPSSENDATMISALEESFRRLGYKRASGSFLWDAFGESVVLSLIRLKELEARNISAVAFGVEHVLGSKAIMQKLVYA
jgi:V/A-type H+-transporting ATPase subunit C